jgi:hypothetical protein
VASLLNVITISLLITRVATIALTATGLSRELARFQEPLNTAPIGYRPRLPGAGVWRVEAYVS